MPELPEVEITKLGITPFILDKKVCDIWVRNPRLRYPVPDDFSKIIGQKVIAVNRRAKYLIIDLEADTLIIHLGMSGSLSVLNQEAIPKKHDHVVMMFETGKALFYHDPRRFGFMLLYPKGVLPDYLLTLAPEPLSDEFNVEYLYPKIKSRTRAIKSILMDQKLVVGVGNIYANEALFMAKIHPECAGNLISKKALERLINAIKAVLTESIKTGGTTLKDFVNPDGNPGYFAQELKVYGKEGAPCTVCATPIKRMMLVQRATYWCPKCQKDRIETKK